MSCVVVIPARYASVRLPGKPLVDIAGKPMVVRVHERAVASGVGPVVVASDDERVVAASRAHGADAVLTSGEHASGTDRIAEVVSMRGLDPRDVVVNVQGDEPLIPPTVIDQVAGLLRDGSCGVATLYEPIERGADVFDPNIVKVVVNGVGRALYFSRAPMPWWRDGFRATEAPDIAGAGADWKRHIGIYAYRVAALREFVHWPPSALEETEALEQLRLLDHGRAIAVAEAAEPVPGGVDTEADAARVRAVLATGTDRTASVRG